MEEREMTELRYLVKSYNDYQLMRIRTDNRLKKRKDGTSQKINEKVNKKSIVETKGMNLDKLGKVLDNTKNTEKEILDTIKEKVHEEKIWKVFLKDVKGIGEWLAAVLIAEFDIHRANTVSKMYAYAGLSPGMTYGKKWNEKKDEIIITEVRVKQDKKTPGFLCPYNQWLRAKLIGVIAPSFLKCKSPYTKHFYDYKHRLECLSDEEKKNKGLCKSQNPSNKNKPYALHIKNRAIRHMLNMFLLDLYIAWRKSEGLPVRQSYAEEKLNKKHEE